MNQSMKPPILREIPDSFETERLLIRCPMPGDGAAVNAAVVESAIELKPWMPWADPPPTVDQSEEFARKARAHFIERSDLPLLMLLKGTGEIVGGTGFHRIKWEVPAFEIGYWCRTSLTGRGLVTEAIRGMTKFAFETMAASRVEIRCADTNLRSRRVAERAGYTLEGILRNNGLTQGALRNTLLFSMVPAEYERMTR